MLVLGTYRDTELGRHTPADRRARRAASAAARWTASTCAGWPLEDVAALARSLLGSDDVAPRVHARTDGNAFFVEEVLRGLAESGPQVVPESVRHAVGVRLSRMGDDANELIAAAAILGLEHDARALQATAGLEPDAAEAALDEVLRARLLRPGGDRRSASSSRTRSCARRCYDELNVLRRARLHRRAAEALTALGEDRHLEEIAMHLFEAASTADARRAAEMLARAGSPGARPARLRGRGRALRARARGARARGRRGRVRPRPARPRRRAAARRRARRGPRGVRRGAARSRCRRADHALLAQAALGFAGLGIAIVDLDAEAIARLEEALERVEDPALRSRVQARLAVELYYAPDRTRSEALSAEAVATAPRAGDASALASALERAPRRAVAPRPRRGAAGRRRRHDRGRPRGRRPARRAAGAQLARDGPVRARRHAGLARGDGAAMPGWPTSCACPRSSGTRRCGRRSRRCSPAATTRPSACAPRRTRPAIRAGDRNAELFAGMVRFCAQLERGAFEEIDIEFVEDKIANSPAGPAYRGSYAWILAGRGETERARDELDAAMALPHAFDANWLSLQAECAEASILLEDATHAATLYDRLAPYAGRPVTAGRAVCSYGAVDRLLGGLAAAARPPRRRRAPPRRRHRLNEALGCTVWRAHAERQLTRIAAAGPLAN